MWDEFLSRRSIKTPFSKHLYPSEMLTDFNSMETEIAINKYTTCFKLNDSEGLRSYDYHNPFYLRVSCEISRSLKIPLKETVSIKETFRRYLAQKTSLMTSPDECNRLLLAITQILLEHGLPQISESELLKKLNFPFTEKLTTDLFAFNILYRYVDTEGRCMIGFYFSGIRDYLIAVIIMQLDRTKRDIRATHIKEHIGKSYLSESAIIWFFRTGTNLEKSDVLHAVIECDQEQNTSFTPKLIRVVGERNPSELLQEVHEQLIDLVNLKFETQRSNHIKCAELLDMVDCLQQDEKVETLLVELFEKISDGADGAMLSSRISNMLSKFDGAHNTRRLLKLALDQQKDDYVRRYIVEAIGERSGFDKKKAFKELYTDPSIDLRSWVQILYIQAEDEELRDLVLELLDNDDISLANSANDYLQNSKLSDTPKLLLEKITVNSYHEHILSWSFRCIAELNYVEAIPNMLELLKSTQNEELRDNLIISLGDLKAREAIPLLMEMMNSLDQSSNHLGYWIEMSLANIGDWDKNEMIKIAKNQQNISAAKAALNVLRRANELTSVELIKKFMENNSIDIGEKQNFLASWDEKKTEEMIEYIYSLVSNSDLAPLSISILLNGEENIEKLAHFLKQNLPNLSSPINSRHTYWWNLDNIKSLAVHLRPWIHNELLKGNWTKPFIQSMLILLQYGGNITSVEILKTMQNEITEIVGSEVFVQVEYSITSSKTTVNPLQYSFSIY
jgi:hypothetical protein